GLIGGLPITQVIVRSSANIQSGGKTKMSAFFHGILILFSVMLIPGVMNMIPLSSLAAILFLVGYKLAKPSLFKEMKAKGRGQFIPFMITILGIIFTDLLIGIGIGMAVAVFLILRKNLNTPFSYVEKHEEGGPFIIELSENVTFLNKASILQTLNMIPNNSNVLIDLSKSKYIHPDVIEIINDFEIHAKNTGIELTMKGKFDENKINPVAHFRSKVNDGKNKKKSYWATVFNS
ncbi:MAG: SulP family inorganic anion transporter, partial [Fulvivirga sp.]|uniref:SulP family inorganic anion transporter n=1 Tax=Fulvivirga sp. TaxID=1931237 RepID=UPI0032EC24A0